MAMEAYFDWLKRTGHSKPSPGGGNQNMSGLFGGGSGYNSSPTYGQSVAWNKNPAPQMGQTPRPGQISQPMSVMNAYKPPTGNYAAPSYGNLSAPTNNANTNISAPTSNLTPQPNQQGWIPQEIKDALRRTGQLPTGYTPEQELSMRNRIRSTDTAQGAGVTQRVREMMAKSGMSGSGAEAAALANIMRGQGATRQGALSNLDISNAQTDLANRYQQAGLMNQLTGMGEGARQFGVGQENQNWQFGNQLGEGARQFDIGSQNQMSQFGANLGENARQFDQNAYNQMFQYGQNTDYMRQQNEQQRNDYMDQLKMMLQQMGLSGGRT